jgi:hypothetical protein
METTVRARFDGHVVVPEQPVHLSAGTVVNVPLPTTPPSGAPAPLGSLGAKCWSNFPATSTGRLTAPRSTIIPLWNDEAAMILVDTRLSFGFAQYARCFA